MEILYKSTRGGEQGLKASEAVLKGIASDGGLFVPETMPQLTESLDELAQMDYRELAYTVMSKFLTDYSEEELRHCINSAYDSKFDTQKIAPLVKYGDVWYLELFHGKTIAFKDMALSILPHLMTTAAKKNALKEEIVILTATSGDTGKAAMAGFADVPGTHIIVFYPKNGVSPVQERQMVTQKGDNTHVVGILGNFDDAQTAVKKMFGDAQLIRDIAGKGYVFSSANSINIGRLVPQVVYYVYSYMQLLKAGEIRSGEKINIVVPTGNFGNILAAYYAKLIGLPVNRLICASNMNKVLYDFFSTGVYDKRREFYITTSPSMDILVSSNLERLIFRITDDDAGQTAEWMKELSVGGKYEISEEMRQRLSDFCPEFCTEEESAAAINEVYKSTGYVIDPHTSVGAGAYLKYRKETGDGTRTVIASTASPYKFARSVLHAIDPEAYDAHDDMQQFEDLRAVSGVDLPNAIQELMTAEVLHDTVVETEGMEAAVRKILGAV